MLIYLKYTSCPTGNIVLPVFQRQYVWDTSQKCNLLKSICAELTIGSLIFWKPENPDEPKKKISNYNFGKDLKYLILDGQQRITFLTQLYDESKKPLDINSYEYYISFPEDGFGIEVQAEKPSPENGQERSKNSIKKNSKEQRYNVKRLLEEGRQK